MKKLIIELECKWSFFHAIAGVIKGFAFVAGALFLLWLLLRLLAEI